MQLRPMLVLCVAIASGLMSAIHLYLISSRAHSYISVALEIPVQRAQGLTNLELNIHSVGDSTEPVEQKQQRDARPDHSSETEAADLVRVQSVPFDQYWEDTKELLGEAGDDEYDGDVLFKDDDEEDYGVLLDTGEYELEEKDMDKTEPDSNPSLPPPTQNHRKHFKKRRRGNGQMRPTTAGAYSSQLQEEIGASKLLDTDESSERDEVQEREVATVAKPVVHEVEDGNHKGPFVMSKEEYYARQATYTHPPPSTHPPHHHNHKNHTLSSSQCSQPPCLQFLSSEEKYIFNKCQKKTVTKKNQQSFPGCKCKFRSGIGKKRVALVSLPGSGNTWVRGLLEKASGLCTGSIYCDRSLREGGFCGEGLRGSSLLAVKTHDSSLQWRGGKRTDATRPVFDKAIFLIRNPFKANIAEWNRQVSKKYASDQTGSSHVKYVTNEAFFGRQAGWQTLVKYQTHKWRLMLGSNLRARTAGRPVLPVFFEDIKKDPTFQLSKMMEFLEFPVPLATINATVMDGFTSYYRNHTDHFDHYTTEQRLFVNGVISSTADALQDKTPDIAKRLREYYMHL